MGALVLPELLLVVELLLAGFYVASENHLLNPTLSQHDLAGGREGNRGDRSILTDWLADDEVAGNVGGEAVDSRKVVRGPVWWIFKIRGNLKLIIILMNLGFVNEAQAHSVPCNIL